MLEMLYQMIYILMFVTLLFNLAVARVMYVFHIGDSKILSAIIGTGVGFLFFWLVPFSMIGIVASVVVTVVGNLILTHIVYPKLDDKTFEMEEKFERKEIAAEERDYRKVLNAPSAEERVKFLCRHMLQGRFHCFRYTIDYERVVQAVNDAIKKSGLKNDYPDFKLSVGRENETNKLQYIQLASQDALISFEPIIKNNTDYYLLGIKAYDDGHLGMRARIAMQENIGHLLDSLYVLINDTLINIDDGYKAEFVPIRWT